MPTDHLEPYRKMARSLRFVPPLSKNLTWQPPAAASANSSTWNQCVSVPSAPSAPSAASLPPIDPSDHAEQIIRAAVARPTVLPPIYVLPESLGDRISRLTDAEPPKSEPVVFLPKIPQPDPAAAMVAPALPASSEPLPGAIAAPSVTSLAEAQTSGLESPPEVTPTTEPQVSPVGERVKPASDRPTVEELIPTLAHSGNSIGAESDQAPVLLAVVEPSSTPDAAATQAVNKAQPTASDRSNDSAVVTCPQCSSSHVRRNGRRAGKQRYVCQDCGRQFNAEIAPSTAHLAAVEPNSAGQTGKSAAKKRSRGFGVRQ